MPLRSLKASVISQTSFGTAVSKLFFPKRLSLGSRQCCLRHVQNVQWTLHTKIPWFGIDVFLGCYIRWWNRRCCDQEYICWWNMQRFVEGLYDYLIIFSCFCSKVPSQSGQPACHFQPGVHKSLRRQRGPAEGPIERGFRTELWCANNIHGIIGICFSNMVFTSQEAFWGGQVTGEWVFCRKFRFWCKFGITKKPKHLFIFGSKWDLEFPSNLLACPAVGWNWIPFPTSGHGGMWSGTVKFLQVVGPIPWVLIYDRHVADKVARVEKQLSRPPAVLHCQHYIAL